MNPETTTRADLATPPRGRWRRFAQRGCLTALALFLTVAITAAFWLTQQLARNLPAVEGEIGLAGLEASVTIERDAMGIPTIRGSSRLDVSRALGFVHGQERFFQMDLVRRRAAGELAELLGRSALAFDRRVRVHRFRSRAREVLDSLPPRHRHLLEAYVEGVNAGLAALRAAPFEYAISRTTAVPWRGEDSLLAFYAMYLDLQASDPRRESAYGLLHELLPPALFRFLAPRGTEWDTPMVGQPFVSPPIPAPEEFDLRNRPWPEAMQVARASGEGVAEPRGVLTLGAVGVGSNNWAVAGWRTKHGGALLANDMHLSLGVPNIWYRAALVYPDPEDPATERRISGITLPGMMVIVAGSNGRVAWGHTNSHGDWSDLVILETDPEDPERYLTPRGARRFEHHRETIAVRGGRDEELDVAATLWGPVWDRDHEGRQRVLRWIAHDRQAVNLGLLELEAATGVEEAIELANRTGTPAQNFVAADIDGRIGWTIMGPMPRRFGHDGRLPSSWADGSRGWDGRLLAAEHPRIVDPESGRIWTANSRVVGGEMLARIGDGGYDLGARARQIRDRLLADEQSDASSLLDIQLDDRALFLDRWRDLLLEVLTPDATAADPRRAAARREVEGWSGRASVDSVAYLLVRSFRFELTRQIFRSLTAPCKAADKRFSYGYVNNREGPLWRLVSERPQHLLDPRFDRWQDQFLAAVDAMLDDLLDGGRLEEQTWGAHNQARIRHPLSYVVPLVGRWLDMPATPLPGDYHMPRVQAGSLGASMRMVVSPGKEEDGILHMPGGQSGNPTSPHYRDSHPAWEAGRPASFLPGPAERRLVLVPTASPP